GPRWLLAMPLLPVPGGINADGRITARHAPVQAFFSGFLQNRTRGSGERGAGSGPIEGHSLAGASGWCRVRGATAGDLPARSASEGIGSADAIAFRSAR